MKTKPIVKTNHMLIVCLILMAAMIFSAVLFRSAFLAFLLHPALYNHARFLHIAAATLFLGNAVAGMLWERRSLASGRKEVILHTYTTVAWLDSRFSSPLIILAVLGGLSLSVHFGDIWEIGWLSVSFLLFLFSGFLWIVSDIPTQYKVKRLMAQLDPNDLTLPAELVYLLKLRWWISMAGVVPLVIVFLLMVYQPDITAVADWFS